MKLLHLDSSILGDNSVSRILSADLVATQKSLHPDLEVTYHDLAAQPLQHLTGAHLAAFGGAPAAPDIDLAASGAALEAFLAADIVVVGAPMYNFSVSSQLKVWIDRVVVSGKTFRYGPNGPEGLVPDKKVLIASARGGSYFEKPIAFLDHQEAYLQAIFGFMGIKDVAIYRAEGLGSPAHRDKSVATAKAEIAKIAG